MEKFTFCYECNDDVEYDVKTEIVDVDLDGVKFAYEAVVANCRKCGCEVHVAEIDDLNIIRAYTAQKKRLEETADSDSDSEES